MEHKRYARTFFRFSIAPPKAVYVKTQKAPVKQPSADGWDRITINLDPELAELYSNYVKSLSPRRSLSAHVADLIRRDYEKGTSDAGEDFEREGDRPKGPRGSPPSPKKGSGADGVH
jgi:hypothetical protein